MIVKSDLTLTNGGRCRGLPGPAKRVTDEVNDPAARDSGLRNQSNHSQCYGGKSVTPRKARGQFIWRVQPLGDILMLQPLSATRDSWMKSKSAESDVACHSGMILKGHERNGYNTKNATDSNNRQMGRTGTCKLIGQKTYRSSTTHRYTRKEEKLSEKARKLDKGKQQRHEDAGVAGGEKRRLQTTRRGLRGSQASDREQCTTDTSASSVQSRSPWRNATHVV